MFACPCFKSGTLLHPRTARSGTLWAWVDVQDCEKGSLLRFKAFGDQTRQIIGLNLLGTYNCLSFRCEAGGQGKNECKWVTGASVETADEPFDAGDTWDQREYAPLSDVVGGSTRSNGLDFIVKLVRKKDHAQDNMVLVHFADEEGTETEFLVHDSYAKSLALQAIYVIHRAKIVEGQGVIEEWSMLARAPQSYYWEDASVPQNGTIKPIAD